MALRKWDSLKNSRDLVKIFVKNKHLSTVYNFDNFLSERLSGKSGVLIFT